MHSTQCSKYCKDTQGVKRVEGRPHYKTGYNVDNCFIKNVHRYTWTILCHSTWLHSWVWRRKAWGKKCKILPSQLLSTLLQINNHLQDWKFRASSSTYVFCRKGIKEKVSIQGGPLPACLNLRGISGLRSLSYFDLSFPGYFDTHLTYLGSRNWRILCRKKYPASLLTKEARLGCYNFFFLFTRRRQTKTLWQHLYNFLNFLLAFVYFSTSFILLKF